MQMNSCNHYMSEKDKYYSLILNILWLNRSKMIYIWELLKHFKYYLNKNNE